MENDDLEVDDLIKNLDKKKKIKSGRKGKKGERDIVDALNARFEALFNANPAWGKFSRSIGSGNRWGQSVFLPAHAKLTFTGDLTCPEKFKFVIESKCGYNDIDLFAIFGGKCKELDDFIKQVSDDSTRSGRMPLLIWKKDRKEKVAFVKKDLFTERPATFIVYHEWVGVSLTWLLETKPDEFFFEGIV